MEVHTVIVGGGMAGLACAVELESAQMDWLLLEAADRPGGRVATDVVDGFRLDRGFQVLLTAYPEAQRLFDYEALGLRSFASGASVQTGNGWSLVGDPLRHPADLPATVFSRVGTLADKLRVLRWRYKVSKLNEQALMELPESSAISALREMGFSGRMIDQFWRPFFGGIFLDPSLQRSSRLMDFVFRMFSGGTAALPAGGIAALPAYLQKLLPINRVRTGCAVASMEGDRLILQSGAHVRARNIVIATDTTSAAQLVPKLQPVEWLAVNCDYFCCDVLPARSTYLHLSSRGVINNVAFPSAVQNGYAPPGKHLISVTHFGDSNQAAVKQDLLRLWGKEAQSWQFLTRYSIPRALPARANLSPAFLPLRFDEHRFVVGDHRGLPSLNSALASGRLAAEAVLDS